MYTESARRQFLISRIASGLKFKRSSQSFAASPSSLSGFSSERGGASATSDSLPSASWWLSPRHVRSSLLWRGGAPPSALLRDSSLAGHTAEANFSQWSLGVLSATASMSSPRFYSRSCRTPIPAGPSLPRQRPDQQKLQNKKQHIDAHQAPMFFIAILLYQFLDYHHKLTVV